MDEKDEELRLWRRFGAFVYSAWSADITRAGWNNGAADYVLNVLDWLKNFDGMDLSDPDLDRYAEEEGLIPAMLAMLRHYVRPGDTE